MQPDASLLCTTVLSKYMIKGAGTTSIVTVVAAADATPDCTPDCALKADRKAGHWTIITVVAVTEDMVTVVTTPTTVLATYLGVPVDMPVSQGR